jgi:hypothetical protein
MEQSAEDITSSLSSDRSEASGWQSNNTTQAQSPHCVRCSFDLNDFEEIAAFDEAVCGSMLSAVEKKVRVRFSFTSF